MSLCIVLPIMASTIVLIKYVNYPIIETMYITIISGFIGGAIYGLKTRPSLAARTKQYILEISTRSRKENGI